MTNIGLKWAKRVLSEKPGHRYERNSGKTYARRWNAETGEWKEVEINFGDTTQTTKFNDASVLMGYKIEAQDGPKVG